VTAFEQVLSFERVQKKGTKVLVLLLSFPPGFPPPLIPTHPHPSHPSSSSLITTLLPPLRLHLSKHFIVKHQNYFMTTSPMTVYFAVYISDLHSIQYLFTMKQDPRGWPEFIRHYFISGYVQIHAKLWCGEGETRDLLL
jgi:hypothetical protein